MQFAAGFIAGFITSVAGLVIYFVTNIEKESEV